MNDLKQIIGISTEATRIERARCLKAVEEEPELTDEMPDEMFEAIRNDKAAITEALRVTVRETKKGIAERISA